MFHAALALCPGFHYSEMEVATRCWRCAGRRGAEWYLRRLRPSRAMLRSAAPASAARSGRHAEALRALQQAHGCDPTDPE